MVVVLKVGTWYHPGGAIHHAKELKLQVMQRLDVNRTDLVVGIQPQGTVDCKINKERQEGEKVGPDAYIINLN